MKKILLIFTFFIFSNILFALNINTATKEDLLSLKGIGEKKALSILEYRKIKSFKKIEDIMEVKGIGKGLFEQIKNDITVSDSKDKKK